MDATESQKSSLLIIFVSFVVASMLSVYPLSASMAVFRPLFLMMVLTYWLLLQPKYVGLFSAFLLGILSDLLLDTRLGQQAFCAVLLALTLRVCSIYVKQLTKSSAWIIATLCLCVFQITLWCIQYLTQNIFIPEAAISLAISVVSWPVVAMLLKIPNRYVK